MPQRLKPSSFNAFYVRAEARTLHKYEFFRSLWKAVPFERMSFSADC
jgi:hypothetical protein